MEFEKKSYFIFVLSNFITLPFIGWIIGGIVPAILGFFFALIIDKLFPTWKYDLSWEDIDNALNNIFRYGNNPCELCFIVNKKKIYIYRDERGDDLKPVRMSVRIPVKDWAFLFDTENFHELVKIFGGKGQYHNNRGPYCYGIFPRNGVDGCKEVLRYLIENSVGNLGESIYAQSIVNAKKNVWLKYDT